MKLFVFFFSRAAVIFVLTFIVFSLIRTKYFRRYKKRSNAKREFYLSIFAGYVAVACLLLFMPNAVIARHGIDLTGAYFDFVGNARDRLLSGAWGVNFIPFKTIRAYFHYSGFLYVCSNILGNVILFLPFGFFLPTLYKKAQKLTYTLRNTIMFSIFIEFIQFFIGRSVDIDDVMLNTLGGVLGYLLFRRWSRRRKDLSV